MSKDELAISLYQSISEDNKPREMKMWHASSIANCPRAQYFNKMGVPPVSKPTAAKMLRWQAGHLIEEVVRPHLLKIYPDLVSNQRLESKKLDLTGEFDNYSEENKLLIEVKSVGPRAPRFRKQGEDRYHLREDGPYLAHEYQNHAYVLLLREAGKEVDTIIYLYVTLEGLILSYETKVQENILQNVEKRLEVLQKALQGTIPDCQCKPDHPLWGSSTQFCDYRTESDCCNLELLEERKKDIEAITPEVMAGAKEAFG